MSKDSALSRALARIDELEAENAKLRDTAQRIIAVESYLLPSWQDVVPHIAALRSIVDAPNARKEQAQESTGGCIVVDHRTDPPKTYDGRHVHEWTPTKDSFGAPTETCFFVCERHEV